MSVSRREFLKRACAGAAGVWTSAGLRPARAAAPRVVVVGGGFAGTTAAKYIRMWSPDIAVTLIERNREFISCPMSNRVLAGTMELADLTRGYGALASRYGARVVHEAVTAIDPDKQEVSTDAGETFVYDRLIVAPGVELLFDQIRGLETREAQEKVLHAWKAGPQTVAMRRQLEAMRDGGVYAISMPKAPYRCPPGPYERACQVAWYFKQHKPKSKVLILDANDKVQSKEALFKKAWAELYPGMVEYRPNSTLLEVDAATLTARFEFEDVEADVLNVVPPQRAADIAVRAGLVTANDKWCGVDFLSYESLVRKNIHVLGDAIVAAPAMPKSGHMANQQAKVCAAALIELLHGRQPSASPMLTNTCYSFVSDRQVIHVASVHRYDAAKKTMVTVAGSGGVSSEPNQIEGDYAEAWGRNIWGDMLG
jgi:NADPH-dependent 2,4-dienoyl-CoA reductase/sulfur reductase-like enzyme